eukprot:284847-Hanusia_phi.AAC.1
MLLDLAFDRVAPAAGAALPDCAAPLASALLLACAAPSACAAPPACAFLLACAACPPACAAPPEIHEPCSGGIHAVLIENIDQQLPLCTRY